MTCDSRKLPAVALLLTTTFATTPVPAADFSTPKPVIGSVSAVGSVDLRDVGIFQEGTLFAGDGIRANDRGYAKVLLGTGSKIEVYERTVLRVNRDAQGVKIEMTGGVIGITAKSPLRIEVAPYEVIASTDASAHVGYLSSTTAGVKTLNGKVTVRNTKTSESFVVLKGHEQLLGLQNGIHAPSLGEIAANVPAVPPVPIPSQTPAGKARGGLAMDTGAWLVAFGAGALGAISIWALVEAHNTRNDINSLKNTINNLNTTVATNQAAAAASLKNLQLAEASSANISGQQSFLNQALLQAQSALLALQAAGQGNSAVAQGLRSIINQINNQLSALAGVSASTAACVVSNTPGCGNQAAQNANNLNAGTNQAISNSNNAVNAAKQQCPSCNIQGGNVQGFSPVPLSVSAPVTS